MKMIYKQAIKAYGLLLMSGIIGSLVLLPVNVFYKSALATVSIFLGYKVWNIILEMNK